MTKFGIAITFVYAIGIVVLRWPSLPELQTMPLNEFGDFFAGVFGPLMLFWLILGYIQQQKELRQNTNALEMQAEELKKSVEQHRELVDATKEQVKAELKALQLEELKSLRSAYPYFNIESAGCTMVTGGIQKYEIKILNSGKNASSIKFETDPPIKKINSMPLVTYLGTGKSTSLKWDVRADSFAPPDLKLIINCNDSNACGYTKIFEMKLDEHNQYHLIGTAEVG